jgi:hypothetical protein
VLLKESIINFFDHPKEWSEIFARSLSMANAAETTSSSGTTLVTSPHSSARADDIG